MQKNNKLRQKQRSSKGEYTQVKVRPSAKILSPLEITRKIGEFLQAKSYKLKRARLNRDRNKRSPWLIEQLKHKAELKRERILRRNFRVEVLKQRNYNGV